MIRNDDPDGEIRDKIVELRGVMDDVERKLTSTGLTAPGASCSASRSSSSSARASRSSCC